MSKIMFLDLDGPMIPGRSYSGGHDPNDLLMVDTTHKFDPIAVQNINDICEKHGWKIVLHTSWVRIAGGQFTYDYCIKQGINSWHFHENAWVDEDESWRFTRIARWLEEHPEVQEYVIIDDTPYSQDIQSGHPHPNDMKNHLMLVSFDDGLLTEHYKKLSEVIK